MREAGGLDLGWIEWDAGRNIDFPESVFPSSFFFSFSSSPSSPSFSRNNRFSNWCNEPELYTLHCTTRSLLIRFCLRELTKGRRRDATGIKSESFALCSRSVGSSQTKHRHLRLPFPVPHVVCPCDRNNIKSVLHKRVFG